MKLPSTDALPPPPDLGAPAKFKTWRPTQIDAVLRTPEAGEAVCFNVPTGGGKSLTGIMSGVLTDSRTLVLTANKALEQQYETDFSEIGLFDVRGQNNYECLAVKPGGELRGYGARGGYTSVENGPCHLGLKCSLKFDGCTWYDAVREAKQKRKIVSTNYSFWLALGKMLRSGRATEEPLGGFDLLVMDECHAAVDEMCKALRIELPRRDLQNLLGLDLPADRDDVMRWRKWGEESLLVWGNEMDRLRLAVSRGESDSDLVADWKIMQRLGTALEQVADLAGDWVIGESWRGTAVTFDPVWPTDYCAGLLYRKIPRLLLMSATVTPDTLERLGLSEATYIEYPSDFPVNRRPVYILDGAPRVDFRMKDHDEATWVSLIDSALRAREDRKGIVHCVSYARMERLKRLSKYSNRFITHTDSRELRDAVEEFKKAGPGAVLLSPSITTGEDFPDDECRYVIIPKLPFPDQRDPIMKRREATAPGYGGSVMMQTLMQSAGRGDRHNRDWCETIIIDGHAKWALPKNKKYATGWFQQAWKWVYALPEPLEF